MSQTRRLAAILAADVAGFSRLMGADEAGTVQALREHRAAADPLVAQHGGRIVKTTGDGVLIEFGSVVGAVECALSLQTLSAEQNAGIAGEGRMEWRIGVHLGDVLIEGDDILGDGVNIAARLEGIAAKRRAVVILPVRPPCAAPRNMRHRPKRECSVLLDRGPS
jgi:class 3 adenylate cyclase